MMTLKLSLLSSCEIFQTMLWLLLRLLLLRFFPPKQVSSITLAARFDVLIMSCVCVSPSFVGVGNKIGESDCLHSDKLGFLFGHFSI